MCGIAGVFGPGADGAGKLRPGAGSDDAGEALDRMLLRLAHRGPDDAFARFASRTGSGRPAPSCVLGARRLAIVDPEHGRQPVANEDGSVVVAMNGEVYGCATLRRDLEARGRRLRTRCDTEVVLRLYEELGDAFLERIDGMFAIAVFDARRGRLLLARDRMGEKPLVWFEAGGTIVFASEMRALAAHPDAPRDLDLDAVALYLQHRFVPAPRTAIRGIHRLPPAHVLVAQDGRVDVRPYWTLPTPPPSRAGCPGRVPDAEVRRVRGLLEDAVDGRMDADVPVGVFLSGGVDSAALAALASRRGRVPTFTLRTDDPAFDEGEGARRTAEALGTEHHEVVATAGDLARGFDDAFASLDEPIGDAAVVPTLLLARAARERVKVVLSGEGADELFGGYPTYLGARWGSAVARVPAAWRERAARRLARAGHGNVGTAWLVRRLLEGAASSPLERHLAWFGAFSAADQALLWRTDARPAIVDGVGEGLLGPTERAARAVDGSRDPVDAVLRADLLLHLPDALLAKVDRATMLESLEARAPFLARPLVEAAAAMPSAWKVRGLATKVVLKRALEGLVPREVLRRRKRGFAVPVSKALAGALGDRLRDRLAGCGVARDLFDARRPLALLDEHRRGVADHGRRLYALLAFLEWDAARRVSAATPAPIGDRRTGRGRAAIPTRIPGSP